MTPILSASTTHHILRFGTGALAGTVTLLLGAPVWAGLSIGAATWLYLSKDSQ